MMFLQLPGTELPERACENPPPESVVLTVWGETWRCTAFASLPQLFLIKAIQRPYFEKYCSKVLLRKWLLLYKGLENLLRGDGPKRVTLAPGLVLTPFLSLVPVLSQKLWGHSPS